MSCTELPWVCAASGLGHSPARGTPRWSAGTLLAYVTEEECHVIDMQAALERTGEASLVKTYKVVEVREKGVKRHRADLPLAQYVLQSKPLPCSMSWSPPNRRGFLLALADTSGAVKIYAPSSDSTDPLIDISEEFAAKTPSGSPVVEVCFAPSTLCGSPVLCASRGHTLVIWAINETKDKDGQCCSCHLLKSITLEDAPSGANIITGMALSRSWAKTTKSSKKYEVNCLLVLGTNQGQVLMKKLTFKSTSPDSPPALSVSPLSELQLESAVSDVVIHSDPCSSGTEMLIAIAHGIRVSAVVLQLSGSEQKVQRFAASNPCHGVPIVSLCCDTAGVFAPKSQLGSSFLDRGNIVTMDSTGHAVIWRMPEGGQSLEAVQLCNLAAKAMQNYWTAIEQHAICMETRMIRAAAREREFSQDNKLLCGFALSPSHCLLATQSAIPSARTTQIRPVTFLLCTSLGSPSHSFTAMLGSVPRALRACREDGRLQLSLWDVHEAWRSQMFGAGRSMTAMTRLPKEAEELPCAILEATLSWLWDLQETFDKAYDSISNQTFNGAERSASAASCKTTLLLRHTAASNISLGPHLGSSRSLTERWASATARQKHFLNMLREELSEVDELVLCQLRNAWLELGRNASSNRAQRKYSYVEPMVKKPRALQAATCAYWLQRIQKHDLSKSSIAKGQAVRDFVTHVEDIGLVGQTKDTPSFSPGATCQLCGRPLTVDSTLMQASCGSHQFPLCQRDLQPLMAEPHLLCSFCGRCTVLRDGDPAICAWCAAICIS